MMIEEKTLAFLPLNKYQRDSDKDFDLNYDQHFSEDLEELIQNFTSKQLKLGMETVDMPVTYVLIGEDNQPLLQQAQGTLRFSNFEEFFSCDLPALNQSRTGNIVLMGHFSPEDIRMIKVEAKYRLRYLSIVTTVDQQNWQEEV